MFLSAIVLNQMQAQLRSCMLYLPMLGVPILSAFSVSTFVFLPVIIVKLLTLVIYWLALYNGGRAWELRPRVAKAVKAGTKEKEGAADAKPALREDFLGEAQLVKLKQDLAKDVVKSALLAQVVAAVEAQDPTRKLMQSVDFEEALHQAETAVLAGKKKAQACEAAAAAVLNAAKEQPTPSAAEMKGSASVDIEMGIGAPAVEPSPSVPRLPEPEAAAPNPFSFLAGFFSPTGSETAPAVASAEAQQEHTPDKIEIMLHPNKAGSFGIVLVPMEANGREMVVVESVTAGSANAGTLMPNDALLSIDGVDVRRDPGKAMAQLKAWEAKITHTGGVKCEIVRMPPSPSASPPPPPSPPASPPEESSARKPRSANRSPFKSKRSADASPAPPPGHIALGVPEQADGTEGEVQTIANERLRELHEKRQGQKLIRSLKAPPVVGERPSSSPMRMLGSLHIVSFYLILFASVVLWIFSGAIAFAALFLPMAVLNGMWFALIYQVLIRVWLFSKVCARLLPNRP